MVVWDSHVTDMGYAVCGSSCWALAHCWGLDDAVEKSDVSTILAKHQHRTLVNSSNGALRALMPKTGAVT